MNETAYSRSANMRAIKSKNTTPERLVRKIARTLSTGYRLHRKDVPGKPDLAWIGRRKAVFVNGCFWHGHECKHGARVPKQNRQYWTEKVSRNRERDSHNLATLETFGWSVLTLWECELKDQSAVRDRLATFLSSH